MKNKPLRYKKHTNQEQIIYDVEDDVEQVSKDFACSVCKETFSTNEEVEHHFENHGTNETVLSLMKKIYDQGEMFKAKVEEHSAQVSALQQQVHLLQASQSRAQVAPRRPQQPPPRPPTTTRTTKPAPTPKTPAPTPSAQPAASPATPAQSSPQQPAKGQVFKPLPRPKGKVSIRLVGDSIARNIVGPKLEEATGSMVTRTRAYCSQESEEAIYPEKVVTKVVRKLKKPVHTTILGACSTDITNQDTSQGLEDLHTVATVASAHATIENAEYLLSSGLAQQVVVLEHNPRHDDQHKAELATLANTTLHRAREQSMHAEHIMIGVHKGLDVKGDQMKKRFTNDGSNNHSNHKRLGAYDGLHMYSQAGAVAFTASLTHILGQAGLAKRKRQPATQPSSSPAPGAWQEAGPARGFQGNNTRNQPRNQPRNQSRNQPQFNIPTQNMFQGFW